MGSLSLVWFPGQHTLFALMLMPHLGCAEQDRQNDLAHPQTRGSGKVSVYIQGLVMSDSSRENRKELLLHTRNFYHPAPPWTIPVGTGSRIPNITTAPALACDDHIRLSTPGNRDSVVN